MKRTKNNSISFDQYLEEILEEKGEKAYVVRYQGGGKRKGRSEAPSPRILGRLSFE